MNKANLYLSFIWGVVNKTLWFYDVSYKIAFLTYKNNNGC